LALMGVCNITPDSFSDGGRYHAPDAARARIDELLAEGADIVDIGGESTRPGAPEVPAAEQKERVLDAIGYAAARDACVSIDTTNPEVAAAAFEAGASILNDASCLRDEGLARAAAAARGAVILMHTRGTPADMHGFSRYPDGGYDDVVRDVCAEWAAAAERLRSAGVPDGAIVMDPGLGFAKNARQSIELLRRLPEVVAAVRVPVTVGASRKSFLASVDRDAPPLERLGASIAAAIHASRAGAAIVRVHDLRATRQAIDVSRRLAGE
jgi:dihydropteroate synthase